MSHIGIIPRRLELLAFREFLGPVEPENMTRCLVFFRPCIPRQHFPVGPWNSDTQHFQVLKVTRIYSAGYYFTGVPIVRTRPLLRYNSTLGWSNYCETTTLLCVCNCPCLLVRVAVPFQLQGQHSDVS